MPGSRALTAWWVYGLASLASLLVVSGALWWLTRAWLSFYWSWLLAINLLAFLWYWIDKRMAQHDQLRMPELYLHLHALLGGFVGAWLGRRFFHHKSQKPVFALVILVGLLLQIACVYWLFFR
jgi:hypothetical protein